MSRAFTHGELLAAAEKASVSARVRVRVRVKVRVRAVARLHPRRTTGG